jgi:hypothetical protein
VELDSRGTKYVAVEDFCEHGNHRMGSIKL